MENNKHIEETAISYAISKGGNKPETFTDEQIGRLHGYIDGYIDGSNSKWVQAEKVRSQIEVLYKCLELTDDGIRNKADELEQQLKELEGEI